MRTLIIAYNNPSALEQSLLGLVNQNILPSYITVYDNGSSFKARQKIEFLCMEHKVTLISGSLNRGWGGAINHYLDEYSDIDDDCEPMLIMAHDALFVQFDLKEVISYFNDPTVIFVCPQFPSPFTSHYTLLKSFYSRPGLSHGVVKVGHQTAFFTRPRLLKRLRYDEEFWLYGGEYEIFLRAHDMGFKTIQSNQNIVLNPSSDSSPSYGILANKLNSLYYARKRHGLIGYLCRAAVVSASAISCFLRGNSMQGCYMLSCISYTWNNPGKGLNTYRLNHNAQAQYQIRPLH